MRKNNTHRTKQYRGSSPPFQEDEHGHYNWETGFTLTEQYSDDSPYIQLLEQIGDRENESDDQDSEARRYTGAATGLDSIDEDE
jgi:hypothetical protein